MEVFINSNALSEAPYQGERESICFFDDNQTNNLVSELVHGNQSCYLVSGYRGAGKTSFINRVKELVDQKNLSTIYEGKKRKKPHDNQVAFEPVFVYTSYSKYRSQTSFLRQLIRNLFLTFDESLPNGKSRSSYLNSDTLLEFRILNERTFYDVKKQYEVSKEWASEWHHEIGGNWWGVISSIFRIFTPISIGIFIQTKITETASALSWSKPISWVASLLCIGFGLMQFKYVNILRSKKRHAINANELYDDDIAAHYFEKILKNLKVEGFKIIFVLDELDKVDDSEVPKLIHEMKPYLLSGLANFIVIAGQQLTYKYESAFLKDDDAVLRSLFSRAFHVSLKDTSDLKIMLKNKVFNVERLSEKANELVNDYIDQQIYRSKRIPRILINLIRQDVQWREGKAYISLVEEEPDKSKYQRVLAEIEKLVKNTIDPANYKPVIRDYMIVQLYRTAANLENNNDKIIDIEELLGEFRKPDFFHHALFFESLAPCLHKLVYRLKDILMLEIKPLATESNVEVIETSSSELQRKTQNVAKEAIARSYEMFKRELQECVWVLRITLQTLGDESPELIHKYTPIELIKLFVSKRYIQVQVPSDSLFKNFMNNPQILDDPYNLQRAYQITQEARIDFNTISSDVLEAYLRQALRTVFPEYTLIADPTIDFDYMLSEEDPLAELLVDFRFSKSGTIDMVIPEIVRKFTDYNIKEGKGNYYLLTVFTAEPKDSYESEIFKFRAQLRDIMEQRWNDIENRIFIVVHAIQNIKKIFDDLVIIKNFMYAYDINRDGLPERKDVMHPIPNPPEFTFINQHPLSTQPFRNDHFIKEIFRVPSKLKIDIFPEQTQYWRFGIKFSSSRVFPEFSKGRHIESNPDIHVSVGEPLRDGEGNFIIDNEGKVAWGEPNILQISNYYIHPKEQGWRFSEYDGGKVTMTFFFQSNKIKLEVYVNDLPVGDYTYEDQKLNFFKVSAWADGIAYQLKTKFSLGE